MKLAVVGLWHLGTVTAACTAAAGIRTIGIDDDRAIVERLSGGEAPVFEPGLAELVQQGVAAGTLSFSTDVALLNDVDVVWACHDTPVDEDDKADVDYVIRRLEAIFPYLRDRTVVLVSAQLPVGTVAALERAFAQVADGRSVSFACSPENLRLGRSVEIFRNPGRIVVGVRDQRTREILLPLFSRFCDNLIWTSVESAEMAKHALNAFLAVCVSFTNEVAAICERVGADATDIEKALRSDPRIGPQAYVRAGSPFAGGTLARDIRFLSQVAERHKLAAPLIASVMPSNQARRNWPMEQMHHRLGTLAGRRIAVLGLAYKPGTDSLRRSPAIDLLRALAADAASVSAFDPAVQLLPHEFEGFVTLTSSAREALIGAEAAVVATEWPQFRELSPDDFALTMQGRLVIDPGRSLHPAIVNDERLEVVSIGSAA
jgi:UDPglucose 6-dehydrogenase